LRVNLEFTELTDVDGHGRLQVFSTPATTKGGRVVALRVPKGGEMSRGDIDATRVRENLRRQGPRVIKVNDLAKGREGFSRRSSRTCTMRHWPRS